MKMLWAVGQRFLASSLAIAPVRAQKFRIRDSIDRGGQYMQRRPPCLCVDQGGLSGRIRLNTPYSSRLAVQSVGLNRGPRRTPKAYRIFIAQLRGPSRRNTLLPQITIGANVKNLSYSDSWRSIVAFISTKYIKTSRRPASKFQNWDGPQHEFVEHGNGEGGVAVARTPDHSLID